MKKEILLFTGWGATCDVWKPIIPALSNGYQINCIAPAWLRNNTNAVSMRYFDQYVDEIAQTLDAKNYLIAWSMGGLIATALAARYPHLVERMCFVSSVPNFVSEKNINTGIDYYWFQSFMKQYTDNPIRTLKKFLTLQVRGDVYAKKTLCELKNICPFEKYNLQECFYSLQLLNELDLTMELLNINCDKVFIHGEQDAVVNVEAAKHIANISHSPIHLIPCAGHAPQLSHADKVSRIINQVFY